MEEFLFKLIKMNDKVNTAVEKEKNSKKITNIVKPSIKTKQCLVIFLLFFSFSTAVLTL